MMLIEVPVKNSDIYVLTKNLPIESFKVIEPKHIDGSQVIQIFIDLANVIVPSTIAAVSAYLVASKNKDSIKIKFNDGKVDLEIQGKLNDKKIQENELYKALLQLITAKIEGEQDSEIDD